MKGKCPLFEYISACRSNKTLNPQDIDYNGVDEPKKKRLEMSPKGKELLKRATTQEAKNIIKELYRPGATIGDGGTADALRHEKKTGEKVGNRNHEVKAKERCNQITRILKSNPNHPDKNLLESLLADLLDALKGGNKK